MRPIMIPRTMLRITIIRVALTNSSRVGQVVEITEGPFSDFSGTVEEVLADKGKVKVSVSLFGRPTAVELDYLQLRGH